MKELETCFQNIECVKTTIAVNTNAKSVITALAIKDGRPARRLLKNFIEEHNCDISHFKGQGLTPNPNALVAQETLEKFKAKKDLSSKEEYQLEQYVTLLSLYLCCGRIASHGNGYRLYISLPERMNQEIKAVETIMSNIFPNKKVGKTRNGSTNNKSKKWCDISIYDSSIKDVMFVDVKGRKTKDTQIVLANWQKQLIKNHPLPVLKGMFLFYGKIHSHDSVRYTFSHVTDTITSLFQKTCLTLDINLTYIDKRFILVNEAQNAIIDLYSKEKLSIEDAKNYLLNTDNCKTELLEQVIIENKDKQTILKANSQAKKHTPKPMLENKTKQSNYAMLLGLYLGDGHIDQNKLKPNIYRMRIFLDNAYPQVIEQTTICLNTIFDNKVGCVNKAKLVEKGKANMSEVTIHSQYLPDFFPQHGAGKKHERSIVLENWQKLIVEEFPMEFFQGLFLSDGSAFLVSTKNNSKKQIRYQFTNLSEDIKQMFRDTCDQLYIPYCNNGKANKNVSIQRKNAVAFLHPHVGFKYNLTLSSSTDYFCSLKETFGFNEIPLDFKIDQSVPIGV